MIVKIGMVTNSSKNNLELIIDNKLLTIEYNKIFEIGSIVIFCKKNNCITVFKLEEII